MEYREGRCPKCNEVMQVPADRDRIICMFCGQEFSTTESVQADTDAYCAQLAALEANMDTFFENADKTVAGFKRNSYEESFQAFCIRNSAGLKAVGAVMRTAGDKKTAEREIAELFAQGAQRLLDRQKSRIGKENMQISLNMLMVTYIMASVFELKEDFTKELTDTMCSVWAEHFKNSTIKAADYESIKSGFRTKLCYITTAVCESLKKPAECYELTLLKQYRDGYLLSTQDGEELVSRYYDIAPTIVKRINKSSAPEEKYRMIWETYLRPCVRLIEEQRNEECREVYMDMVKELHREFMEDRHE